MRADTFSFRQKPDGARLAASATGHSDTERTARADAPCPRHSTERRALLAGGALACVMPLQLVGCADTVGPLRVAAQFWPGYESLFLARELGILEDSSVRLIEMPSSAEGVKALIARSVDAVAMTLDEMLSARAAGLPLQAVLVFDVSNGADAVLSIPAIRTLKDMAGRKVGVDASSVGALMLDAALRAAGLAPGDVKRVQIATNRQVEAFRSGEVEVLLTGEPMAGQLEREGAHRLFDSSAIPGLIVDVLAVGPATAQRHGRELRLVVAAHFAALAHMQRSPEDAARRMAPRLSVAASQVMSAFKGIELPDLEKNRFWLEGPDAHIERRALELQQLMLANRLLSKPPPAGPVADPRFLPRRG